MYLSPDPAQRESLGEVSREGNGKPEVISERFLHLQLCGLAHGKLVKVNQRMRLILHDRERLLENRQVLIPRRLEPIRASKTKMKSKTSNHPSLLLPSIFLPFLLPCVFASTWSSAGPPNVLLIVSEDNGPELGCYGDAYARTPNLDKLADEGIRFNRAFVAQAGCSQSRASFLTGLYPHQQGQMCWKPPKRLRSRDSLVALCNR